MSNIWSEEERKQRLARLTGTPPDRATTCGKWIGVVGCLLLVGLLVGGLAGVVALIWRLAIR